MAKVTIIGAGHSGLQLGIGLLKEGHQVRIFSNRTPEQVRIGQVASSQVMYSNAIDTERELGIDFWADQGPDIAGFGFSIPSPELTGQKALCFDSRFDRPAKSVDQRVKFVRWMELFMELGGRLEIREVAPADLEELTREDELVIIATGKGGLAGLFERDPARSPYDRPMRALAITYLTPMPRFLDYSALSFNVCPGLGEAVTLPAISAHGPCEILVMEGIPGGPLDCWADVKTPAEHLAKSKWIYETFFPWETERFRGVELTGANACFTGRFAPVVRKPVSILPSGRPVLGLADAVVLNDPLTGQGSNNAAKSARAYLQAIRARPEGPFDAAWMRATFESFWQQAQSSVEFTNMMMEPPPHVFDVFGAAAQDPRVARRLMNGFDDPRDMSDWLLDPAKTQAYLSGLAAAPS